MQKLKPETRNTNVPPAMAGKCESPAPKGLRVTEIMGSCSNAERPCAVDPSNLVRIRACVLQPTDNAKPEAQVTAGKTNAPPVRETACGDLKQTRQTEVHHKGRDNRNMAQEHTCNRQNDKFPTQARKMHPWDSRKWLT